MQRTILITLVAALAVLAPAPAARGKADDLSRARTTILKQFKRESKDAERLLATVIAARRKVLRGGDTATAVTDVGSAVAFFAESVKVLADDASGAFAQEADNEMAEAGDNDLRGGVAGDGGSLDTFNESLQKEVDKARGRVLRQARKFAGIVESDGQPRERMRVVFNAWPVARLAAPTPGGALESGERSLHLFGTLASRLTNGAVIVTAFGAADPGLDDRFDVRLQGTASQGAQVAIGAFLSAGGMDVTIDGTWSATLQINDPFVQGVDEGNRLVKFGLEPNGARQMHAGVISIP